MFSTGLEGTAAAAKVFGTSCGWMRTAFCAVARQRDVILSRAGWDGRLRTAVVCVSVRMVFALVGHDRALRGRGTPCARLACIVVASCASNNLLSDLAGAGAEGPLFTASATAARSRPARDRFTHQCSSWLENSARAVAHGVTQPVGRAARRRRTSHCPRATLGRSENPKKQIISLPTASQKQSIVDPEAYTYILENCSA